MDLMIFSMMIFLMKRNKEKKLMRIQNIITIDSTKFYYRNADLMIKAMQEATKYGEINNKILSLYADKVMYNRRCLKNRSGTVNTKGE